MPRQFTRLWCIFFYHYSLNLIILLQVNRNLMDHIAIHVLEGTHIGIMGTNVVEETGASAQHDCLDSKNRFGFYCLYGPPTSISFELHHEKTNKVFFEQVRHILSQKMARSSKFWI